ncbi:hypothetical protein TNCV_3237821 [Trichonephila clavipes]|nr:hypothetical protein TNCV_3237821 [Trichonephila clavipes]
MATEMGVEDVLGMRVFELSDAILSNKYFYEEFCREFLNTIIEERERKEEIELDERKGKKRGNWMRGKGKKRGNWMREKVKKRYNWLREKEKRRDGTG